MVAFLGFGTWVYTRLPSDLAFSGAGPSISYGDPIRGATATIPIRQAIAKAKTGSTMPVTLVGRVADMGLVMGCWVRLTDGSGAVMAQTNPMVYMPQRLRGATVRVTGTLTYGPFETMGYSGKTWVLNTAGVDVLKTPG